MTRTTFLLAGWLFAGGLAATAATVDDEPHLEAELVSEVSALKPGQPIQVGLRLRLEPHWHVYWKNPGDAGLPVSLNWTLPAGFSAGPLQWPYPQRIELSGLVNYGYEGEVLFPVEIAVPAGLAPGSRVDLKAKAKWVVCKEICLPGSAEVALSLPVAQAGAASAAGRHAELFPRARAQLPLPASPWTFSARASDSVLTLRILPPEGVALPGVIFFPEQAEVIENAAPQRFYAAEGGGYALELTRVAADASDSAVARGPDTLAGVAVSPRGWGTPGGEKAVQVKAVVERGLPPVRPAPGASIITKPPSLGAPSPGATGFAGSDAGNGLSVLAVKLFLAFLGGIILNLMPCVLPVLSLKVFDIVKRAGQSRWKVFSHGLVFTAGVLISFWILAGLLLVLRRGGQELGWGFQMQSPPFLIVLSALFFFFSLNLFGVFELGYLFTRVGGAGAKHGFGGSFVAGITATVVATPCTAPFMGSAMGYAFTQPIPYAMLVFTFLGLGMASPYLLLAGFPALTRLLPKPGEWMEHLKQFMGFPLLATAIWLAWVLGKQAGVDALIALLCVLLLAGVSAWILGKWTALHRPTPVRIIAGLLALVVFLPAFVLVLVYLDQIRETRALPAPGSAPREMAGEIAWEPYSPERLAELTAGGKPVFIDFTADWCLSCKVNEKIALRSPEVTRKFQELGLTALKADWTLRDEAIGRALSGYGRNSIPLYVLHTGTGEYHILPEIISPRIVLEALDRLALPASAALPPATRL